MPTAGPADHVTGPSFCQSALRSSAQTRRHVPPRGHASRKQAGSAALCNTQNHCYAPIPTDGFSSPPQYKSHPVSRLRLRHVRFALATSGAPRLKLKAFLRKPAWWVTCWQKSPSQKGSLRLTLVATTSPLRQNKAPPPVPSQVFYRGKQKHTVGSPTTDMSTTNTVAPLGGTGNAAS